MTFDPFNGPSFDPRAFGSRSQSQRYRGMRPQPANPTLDIYGGTTPWEQNLRTYQQYGSPNVGKRPFEGLGKTNVTASLPFAPAVNAPRNAAPTPVGAPQPGMFEALGSGLGMLAKDTIVPLDILTRDIGGALGFGSDLGADIENNAVNLIGAVGSVFDGILDFVPNALGVDNIEFLPGGGNIEGVYDRLPEDALKQEYDALIAQNPTARMEYMKQYLDRRGTEIARLNGLPAALTELATPSASFSEQLRRIIFGGLMLPQQAIGRTFTGSSLRDAEGTILNQPDENLPEELRELKNRHLSGEINRDEFFDELLLSEYRWTNSDGPESFFLNLALDIGTDPLIWASFGIGGAATTVARTAASSARLSTTGALRTAVKSGDQMARRMVDDIARKQNWKGAPDDLLNSARPEHHALFHDAVKAQRPDLYKEGMGKLNKRQRVAYELDPIIQPAGRIANEIDTLFGFFGAGKVAGRMGAFRQSKHVEGMARGAGVRVVKELQDFFGDEFDSFSRYFGVSAGNLSMAMGAKTQVTALLASSRAVDRVTAAADPGVTPTQLGKASRDRGATQKGLENEAEAAYLRYQETFLPKGEFGDAALDKAAREARESLATDLAAATGKTRDEALKFLEKADRRQLAFTHWIMYGKQIVDFNEGKGAYLQALEGHLADAVRAGDDEAVKRLTGLKEDAERFTLVSENTLTFQDAKTLVASLKSGAADVNQQALDAISQYDQLDMNFGQRGGSADQVRLELVKHLETLIEKDALIKIVDPANLNARVASKLSDRYRVGLKPTDVWGIVKDEDGRIISANPFLDVLSDEVPGLAGKVTKMDRIRAALADPIRGSKLHAEAKVRFRVEAARNFKLRKGEADRLFNAINREAIARQKGARAFGAHELNEIARDAGVILDKDIANRMGERGILHLVLTAFEGDIAMMGLSSATSARIKSKFGRLPMGDNLIGKIAEDYYPKLRFSASPIFLAMEWVEGPFFAILRGVKPGWKYTEQDLRNLQILDTLRPDYAEVGAGIGRAQLAYGDQQIALKVQDIGRWGKTWNKVMPVKALQRPQKRIVGPKVVNVYDLKRLLYQRQAATDAAETFVRAMKEEYPPQVFNEWANAAGSTRPIDIWTAFMEDRGWFNPQYRHTLHMFDAMRDEAKDRIRMGDAAHYLGFLSEDEFRAAVKNGSYTRDALNAEYAKVGAKPDFVERVWRNANGFTVKEWEDQLVSAIGKEEAAATMGIYKFLANASKRNLDEYLNDTFGNIARIVDKSNQVPAAAFRQTVKDSIERAGMTYYTRSAPEFQRALKYMQELLPQQLVDEPGTLRRKIANAQKNVADTKNKKHLPPANDYTRRSYQQMWEDVQAVLPNQDSLLASANWYDEMMTTFLGLTSKMDDATVQTMIDAWKKNVKHEGFAKDIPTDLAEARIVLAARLNVAFSGSQMNTSVLDGMRKVTTILDEVLTGADDAVLRERTIARILNDGNKAREYNALVKAGKMNEVEAMIAKNIDTRFGFEAVRERLESVIRDFGELPPASIAQKLSDFNDNLAGNLRRSSSPDDGLQPAAMDIWMKRVWGFPDHAYFDDLVRHHMDVQESQGTAITRAQAEKDVLKERKWKREWVKELTEEEKKELKKQGIEEGAPTPQQYEWMLKRTNEFKDYLNEQGIPGPNGEWMAHEIQALLWVAEQKRLNYADNPTFSLFQQTGRQLAVPGEPGAFSGRWAKRFPSRAELVAELGHEADSVVQQVNYEVVSQTMAAILPQTKSTIIRTLDGSEDLGTTVVFGSEQMSLASAHHLAAALDQEVVVMGRPPDVTLKATSTKPDPASNIKEQGRHWSFDFAFDPDLTPESIQPHLTSLREYLEQYLSPDEFPHALTALLDDNATSLRFAWDSRNNANIALSLEDAYDIRQTLMATTGGKAKRMRTPDDKSLMAALKKKQKEQGKLSARDQSVLDALADETGARDISLRTPEEQALIDAYEKDLNRAAAGQMNLRQLKEANPLPDHVYQSLEDGSWVKAFDPDAEPVRIEMRHEQVNYQVITPEEGVRYVNDPALVSKYRATAQSAADGAYADLAPAALEAHQRRVIGGEGPAEVFHQRELTGGGRVRAGVDFRTGQHDAALYLVRNLADASSGLHEAFHVFARSLDPSAQRKLVASYNAAHGLTGPRGKYAKRKFTRQVEEWVAAEFETFAAKQGTTPDATFYSTFRAFGDWAKSDPRMKDAMKHGSIDSTLESVMAELTDIPPGFRDLDDWRLNESARISLLRAEEQAHSTAYYRRGPNWMMRSLNHPYLGMYPASYMWGKVLPELSRFLLKKPFGLTAPLGGLQMYNHVHRSIAEEFYTNEEFNSFVEDHPDTVRFLEMMLPGNPVEMPVNLPVVARRAMEHDAENRMRGLAGEEQEPFDLAGSLGDMASYAVGFAQLPDRVGKMIGEWANEDGPNAGKTAPFSDPRKAPVFGPKFPTT